MNSSSVFFTDPLPTLKSALKTLPASSLEAAGLFPQKLDQTYLAARLTVFFFFFFAKILPDNKNEVGDEFDESFWVFFDLDLFV